jgi:hypothetical protein
MLRYTLHVILFLTILGGCKSVENTQVISIGYHSDNCDDCNTLKSKMKSMNRKFIFSPIVFIKYDKTNANTKLTSEEKLKEWHMLEIAQRDDGLKYVILYDAKSKQTLKKIDYNDDADLIKSKIDQSLAATRK